MSTDAQPSPEVQPSPGHSPARTTRCTSCCRRSTGSATPWPPGYPLRTLLRAIAVQADELAADIAHLYDNWFIETCDDDLVPYFAELVGLAARPGAGRRAPARGSGADAAGAAPRSPTRSPIGAARAPSRCSSSSPPMPPAGRPGRSSCARVALATQSVAVPRRRPAAPDRRRRRRRARADRHAAVGRRAADRRPPASSHRTPAPPTRPAWRCGSGAWSPTRSAGLRRQRPATRTATRSTSSAGTSALAVLPARCAGSAVDAPRRPGADHPPRAEAAARGLLRPRAQHLRLPRRRAVPRSQILVDRPRPLARAHAARTRQHRSGARPDRLPRAPPPEEESGHLLPPGDRRDRRRQLPAAARRDRGRLPGRPGRPRAAPPRAGGLAGGRSKARAVRGDRDQRRRRIPRAPGIGLAAGERLEIRAAQGRRPAHPGRERRRPARPAPGRAGPSDPDARGSAGLRARRRLGRRAPLELFGSFAGVKLRHCTLVPAGALAGTEPDEERRRPSLLVHGMPCPIAIFSSILGRIRVESPEAGLDPIPLRSHDCVLDASEPSGQCSVPTTGPPGCRCRCPASPCSAEHDVHSVGLVEDSIFTGPLDCERRQTGTVRFWYLAPGSRTPQAHQLPARRRARRATADRGGAPRERRAVSADRRAAGAALRQRPLRRSRVRAARGRRRAGAHARRARRGRARRLSRPVAAASRCRPPGPAAGVHARRGRHRHPLRDLGGHRVRRLLSFPAAASPVGTRPSWRSRAGCCSTLSSTSRRDRARLPPPPDDRPDRPVCRPDSSHRVRGRARGQDGTCRPCSWGAGTITSTGSAARRRRRTARREELAIGEHEAAVRRLPGCLGADGRRDPGPELLDPALGAGRARHDPAQAGPLAPAGRARLPGRDET